MTGIDWTKCGVQKLDTIDRIRLVGGPSDGFEMPRPSTRSILVAAPELGPDVIARYRATKDHDVYRFYHLDRVVLHVPIGASS